eukprot:8312737-Pyramimonas_sp.AAC.1
MHGGPPENPSRRRTAAQTRPPPRRTPAPPSFRKTWPEQKLQEASENDLSPRSPPPPRRPGCPTPRPWPRTPPLRRQSPR